MSGKVPVLMSAWEWPKKMVTGKKKALHSSNDRRYIAFCSILQQEAYTTCFETVQWLLPSWCAPAVWEVTPTYVEGSLLILKVYYSPSVCNKSGEAVIHLDWYNSFKVQTGESQRSWPQDTSGWIKSRLPKHLVGISCSTSALWRLPARQFGDPTSIPNVFWDICWGWVLLLTLLRLQDLQGPF